MWSVPPLEITVEERLELERRVRAHTSTQRMVKRSRIVLLAAEGLPSRQIGATVGMSEEYVPSVSTSAEADRAVDSLS
jgi:hypothetical protein